MPKISLVDQLAALKGKMGGVFSRAKKPATEKAESSENKGSPSQVKRLAPLVVVAALLGGGYTFQNDIMSLVAPAPSANKPAPLPIARTPAPAPAPAVQEEMIAEMASEPEATIDVMADEVTEISLDDTAEVASEVADASAEMDLIDRKLQAMKALEAMKNNAGEEDPADLAMTMDEERADAMPANEEMMVMDNNDDATLATTPMAEEAVTPQTMAAATPAVTAESAQSNQWTLFQSSNQWAVQLMAVQTKEYLDDFLSQNQLEDSATYFEFTRNGEHFYAVVAGVYNTHSEADEAAQTLAAEFNVAPWVRSMRSIQEVINYELQAEEPKLALGH